MLFCPNCQIELKKAIFYNVEVDYCPKCLGVWFDFDELRQAKDYKDKDLEWLDIDLWKDEAKFKITKSQKLCPRCQMPLYEVRYGDSDIKVDVCNLCHGVWLDRGEFKKIIDYLKEKEKKEILDSYLDTLAKEALDIFVGPDSFKEEISDFLTVLRLLNYKLLVKHEKIMEMISMLPK